MLSILRIKNDEKLLNLVQGVTDDFLQNNIPTPRPYLYQKLEGREDILSTLVQRNFLQLLFTDELVPGLLAFEYDSNTDRLRQAKGYVAMALHALAELFEESGFKRRRFHADEVLVRAKKTRPFARPDHLRVAFLLIPTLDRFFSEYHWNSEHSSMEWVEVSDKILKPDTVETIWASKVREIHKSDEAAQAALKATTTDKGTLQTAFDQYRLIRKIGEGGSGRVWQAKDSRDTDVAIKILNPERATEEKRKRFKNEILFSLSMPHRNIIRVIDFGLEESSSGTVPFYVMPYMDGSLRNILPAITGFPKRLKYFGQLLDALHAAHMKGVVHRDLKPENILYSQSEDVVVLADFGIAHFTDEDLYTAFETRDNSRLANFQYAAPEQRKRGAPVDCRTDVFALGLILCELFTGEVPYGTGYKNVRSVAPEYKWIDDIVEHMIQQDPNGRPSSVASVQISLWRILGGSTDSGNEAIVVHSMNRDEPDRWSPITVRALKMGFYGNSRRHPGDIFEIQHRGELGKWMEVTGDPSLSVAEPQKLGEIVWKPEARPDCLGILIKNAGIAPIESLEVLTAEFFVWSETGNDFIKRSREAMPGAVAIRRSGNLEGSNGWSEFLFVVDCTQVDLLRILSFHALDTNKSEVTHIFDSPGIYRIQIRFRTKQEARDEYLFIHWERGKTPQFTTHPTG